VSWIPGDPVLVPGEVVGTDRHGRVLVRVLSNGKHFAPQGLPFGADELYADTNRVNHQLESARAKVAEEAALLQAALAAKQEELISIDALISVAAEAEEM
jgi:hypothetical protein